MASDQFIEEMHKKLHPGTGVCSIDDLTDKDVAEITDIIKDKHTIRISSDWISDEAKIDSRVFRNILTLASSAAYEGLNEQDEMKIGDFTDGHGKIESQQIWGWEENRKYYQEQIDAIKVIERQLTEKLIAATNQPGFYLRGVAVDGKVRS